MHKVFESRWTSRFEIKPNAWVFVPTPEFIEYGTKVKQAITKKWSSPNYYYHLRSGGHVQALKKHTKHQYFIHLDIQNFFGQINRSRATRCLKEHFSYLEARNIAIKSTVALPRSAKKKYILPFGFVQSAIVASLCLHKSTLGKYLLYLAKQNDLAVSVYMDDIIISSDNQQQLEEVLVSVEVAAKKAGFPLNKAKQEGPCDQITAFNVSLTKSELTITEKRWDEFIEAYKTSTNPNQKDGILNYINCINTKQALFMK